jgi:signal transduction histidine kinase
MRTRYRVVSGTAAWLIGFLAFTAHGLIEFSYRYLDDLMRNRANTFTPRMVDEMSAAYSLGLLFPAVAFLVRRWPLHRGTWYRMIPVHLLGMLAFAAAHTTMMRLSRAVLYPALGLGTYEHGAVWLRYPMEGGKQVLAYWLFVGVVYLFDYYREARDRQVLSAELQARLAQAQIDNLRLQLQPHFLFNVLNTISSVMYEDVRKADAMIAQLSDLLRRTLRPAESQCVLLSEELSLLKLYLGIMQARFGDQMSVDFSIDPAADRALVPQLILQPLVENSIRHGRDAQSARLELRVGARRDNGALLLEVSDHGPGITGTLRKGIGLSNTAERLEGLYGAEQELRLENAPGGGLTVTMRIPFRTER